MLFGAINYFLKARMYVVSCGHIVRDFESEAKTRYNF
jgi:hypothetical protein